MDPEAVTPAADFRAAAVAESQRLLALAQRNRGQALRDPMLAGISYCLPVPGDPASVRRRLAFINGVGLVLGLLGILTGGAIALWQKHYAPQPDPHEWLHMLVAGSASLTGLGVLFASIFLGRSIIGREVRRRLRDDIMPLPASASQIELEDTRTYSKLKAVPEDCGLLIAHPDSGCLQIEGLSHRYLIRLEDLASMRGESMRHHEIVVIKYCVGEATLEMTIKPMSLIAEAKRQIYGGNSGLEAEIHACLAPPENA